MIIVIADDITGAAEIAGAALRYKLDTMLTWLCRRASVYSGLGDSNRHAFGK